MSVILTFGFAFWAQGEILDRTVAVVGSQPITASEVKSQVLLEAMFNGAAPDLSEAARQAALERLIEQRLVEADMNLAGLQVVEEHELDASFEQLRGERFGALRFSEALERYGVKEKDVRGFLQKQLRFGRYVQFRFHAGMQIDDEEVRAAYRRRFARTEGAPPLADVQEEIRQQLWNERAESMLDERVRQLRAETRVVLLDPIEQAPEAVP